MKQFPWFVIFSACLVLGCATSRSDISQKTADPVSTNHIDAAITNIGPGRGRIFTNAQVTIWVPLRATNISDGYTSVVDIDEMTPPGAFVKGYKIEVEIQVVDQMQSLQQMERWGVDDWYFQDHPTLSITNVQYGKHMRKDIWNAQRTRRLLINAMVQKTGTFETDIETAKKMVESVKPLNTSGSSKP